VGKTPLEGFLSLRTGVVDDLPDVDEDGLGEVCGLLDVSAHPGVSGSRFMLRAKSEEEVRPLVTLVKRGPPGKTGS
jgi:hypothetical protein